MARAFEWIGVATVAGFVALCLLALAVDLLRDERKPAGRLVRAEIVVARTGDVLVDITHGVVVGVDGELVQDDSPATARFTLDGELLLLRVSDAGHRPETAEAKP